MMEKSLLILGGRSEFVDLVELAAQKGVRPIVVDGNPDAAAKERAEALGGAAYTIPLHHSERIASVMKKENCSAITTAYSDILLENMVKIASCFPQPQDYCPISMEMLPYYRDKSHMKEAMKKLSIPTPASRILRRENLHVPADFHFPLILKPRDSYGSRGVVIVHDMGELEKEFPQTAAYSEDGSLLLEEYNDEHEFNAQSYVHKGEVHLLGIADRETSAQADLPLPLSTRNIYPSCLYETVAPYVLDAFRKYISFTGQTEGPLCMQFFYGPRRGFEVCEIAARFLGYEHELLSYANGISLPEVLLTAAVFPEELTQLLAQARPQGSSSAAVLYFHGRDGVIADDSAARAIKEKYNLPFAQFFYAPGERIGNPQTQPYVLRYFVTAPTREEVDAITRQVLSEVSVKDENGNELLYPAAIQTRA